MNSPSLPAWAAASSAADSSDGAPSAPSKSTTIAGGYSCSARMMASLNRSLSGTTSPHSTGNPGLDAWISSRADSPARTYPPPAKVPGSTANARDSGAKWRASLAKYDPASCSWKIPQSSLFEDSEPSSVAWPRSGTMRNGVCWERPTLAPRTNGTASGLWPTIRATDADRGGRGDLIQAIRGNPNSHYTLWQTPVADDAVDRKAGKWNSRGEPKLSAQVMMWPTPISTDYKAGCGKTGNRSSEKSAKAGWKLTEAVALWPTPQARDHFPPHKPEYIAAKKAQGHGMSNLNDVVALWPTPTVHGNYNRKGASQNSGDGLATAVAQSNTQTGQPTPPKRLNPAWVEWLMGVPHGWTDLKPLAMARFQEWRQQHLPRCIED